MFYLSKFKIYFLIFIKASACYLRPSGYAVHPPQVSIRSKLLKQARRNGSLRCYVLRTPFCKRSTQLRLLLLIQRLEKMDKCFTKLPLS